MLWLVSSVLARWLPQANIPLAISHLQLDIHRVTGKSWVRFLLGDWCFSFQHFLKFYCRRGLFRQQDESYPPLPHLWFNLCNHSFPGTTSLYIAVYANLPNYLQEFVIIFPFWSPCWLYSAVKNTGSHSFLHFRFASFWCAHVSSLYRPLLPLASPCQSLPYMAS